MNKTCDKCSANIPHGNPYICIVHNVEQMQTDIATQQDCVNVISSEEALILCGNCARHFTAKAMKAIVQTMPITYDPCQLTLSHQPVRPLAEPRRRCPKHRGFQNQRNPLIRINP